MGFKKYISAIGLLFLFSATTLFAAENRLISEDTNTATLVYLLQNSSDSAIRARAAWAIGWYQHDAAAYALMSALSDTTATVRYEAAEALRWVGDDASIPFLLKRIAEDSDTPVRVVSTRSIGYIAFRRHIQPCYAISPLIFYLKQDSSEEVRIYAAKTLGMIHHKMAGPALVETLTDPSIGVRRLSAWSLGEIEHLEAQDALLAQMGDSDPDVRLMVAYALSEISKKQPSTLDAVIPYLHHELVLIRITAVWSLWMSGSVRAIPHLEYTAEHDSDEHVRQIAKQAVQSTRGIS